MISTLELIIFYSYGIPLFIINLRTIYVLATNRQQFSSSYYVIFILCGVNYCLLYITNNYALRLPSIPFLYNAYFSKFDEFSRWHAPIAFIRRFCSYSISFGISLLKFNRLTAVWKYSQYETLWSRNKKIWISFWIIGTSIFSIQEIFNQHKFASFPDGNSTIVYMVSDNYYNFIDTRYWSVVVILTSVISGMIILLLTLYFWRQCRSSIPEKYHNFEKKLIWLTVVIYSLGVLAFLYNLLNPLIFNQGQNNLAYLIVSDTVTLIPIITMIVFSPTLRVMVFTDWFNRKFWNSNNISTAAITMDPFETKRIDHPGRREETV